MTKKRYNRAWLNPKRSYHNGAILWAFNINNDGGYAEIDLEIRDCSNSVRLSLEADNEKEKKDSLAKLLIIKSAINELISDISNHDPKKAKRKFKKKMAKQKAKKQIKKEIAEALSPQPEVRLPVDST